MTWTSGLLRIVHEIHRRSLWQVLGIYLLGAWIGFEVIQTLTEGLGLPSWLPALAVVLFIIGLPVVLATAFVQEGIAGARDEGGVPASVGGGPGVAATGEASARPAARRLLTWRNVVTAGVLTFAVWGVIAAAWLIMVGPKAPAQAGLLTGRLTPLTTTPGLEASPDWSPDGASIVYISERSGNRDLWVRSLQQVEDLQITRDPAEDAQPAWSPDGRRIAFASSRGHGAKLDQNEPLGYSLGGGIWTVPALGGPPTPVLDGGFNPAWSPDGTLLAFDASLDGPRRIWVAAVDGPTPRRLSSDRSDAAIHTHPRWSPNGRWVVYRRQEGTVSDIVAVPADGGPTVWITRDAPRDLTPTWAPDGARIVFASDRSGTINLWAIDVDPVTAQRRGEPMQVTAGAGQDLDPKVAPDGRTLVSATLHTVENLWRVVVDPLDGHWLGSPEPLLISSRNDNQPALAPDGRTAVFSSDRAGDLDLWTVPIDGGVPTPLTSGPGHDRQPDWSPDGRQIAFFSDRGGDNDIWVIPARGGNAVRLTSETSDDTNPYWSPDGRQIAFMSDRSGRSEVWVMDADGRNPRRLTDIGAMGHTARWSPDGTWILFTSLSGGDRNVWAVSSRGGETRRLTPEPSQEAHGLWSPDGRTVYYLTDHRVLRSVPFAGGAPVVLRDVGPGERIDYTHLSRDGRRLLFTLLRAEGDLWLMEPRR